MECLEKGRTGQLEVAAAQAMTAVISKMANAFLA